MSLAEPEKDNLKQGKTEMLYYHVEERSPHFPQHNGHRGWPYYAKTVEGAAVEDLFWRKVQGSPTFAWEVVRTVWPGAVLGKRDVVIPPDNYISLQPESCGAYTSGAWGGLYPLRGDASDIKRIEQGAQRSDRGGYYLEALVAKHTGWLPQNVVPNLLHAMGKRLSVSERFRFSVKANHRQVPMGKALTEEEVQAILKNVCPAPCDLYFRNVYWYKRECGDINFGIIYICDSRGKLYKFPLSAWQADTIAGARPVYDMLNIAPPYPLYDLDKLVQHTGALYSIIFPSEATVDYIRTDHAWISKSYPVTTYASIDDTTWDKLTGITPVIFPEATAWGCREAFRLHSALEKHGLKALFMKRQKDEGCGSCQFIQDLGKLAISHSACRLPEFAEHCHREFGVLPPAGVLPKAVALSSLPEPAVPPEKLIDGLLDTGEQMMIHAWRGVGKSLFALFLALCFAAGKGALNGRVCPSRKYRVLLLDGEMSAHSLKKRARRLCSGHGLPTEAMADVKVRSIIAENKDLTLETEEGLTECMPDLMWADIIVVDSVFKFFHTAMTPEFSGVGKMLDFLKLCRLTGKTLILIDHEGKGRPTSFGTMGKEIALDVVLRLCHAQSAHEIEAHVQKVRDHAEPTGAYIKMRVEADNERITYEVCGDHKAVAALGGESSGTAGEAEATESSSEHVTTLDEAIIQYRREHPDDIPADVVRGLQGLGYKQSRSTINAHIKQLVGAGKLPGWPKGLGTHNAAGLPEAGDDQD